MKESCVRCNNEFNLTRHPMAHASSICTSCNDKEPENIGDQMERDRRNNFHTLSNVLRGLI